MKLYYTPGACSLACRIVINELKLPCEYVAVDLKAKKTESGEDFLKINPKGAVPVLVADSGFVLTENAVIQQYLADTFEADSLLPKIGTEKRYEVLEWLNFIATDFHKGFGAFFNPMLSEEMKKTLFIPLMDKKLAFVNESLENKNFLVNDHFTLPDAYFFVMLTWARHFKFDLSRWPALVRYFKELHDRPSILKSLQEEKLKLAY